MRVQCVTCGGTYDQVMPDGYQYFHVCPPLSVAELARAVQDGRVVLERGESVEEAHGLRIYERTGKRDERAVQRTHEELAPQIVDAGRGVVAAPIVDAQPGVIIVPD
jgi:hypothetical protein